VLGVSARAPRRAIAIAWAAVALACGGHDGGSKPTAAAAPAPQPAPMAEPTPPPRDAFAAPADAAATALDASPSSERVAEIENTEPEGAGLDALVERAARDPDPAVREAAVKAIGDSEEPRALDALIAAASDADSRVVLAAVDQLGWFDDRRAQDTLRRLADSANAEIAAAARDELDEE
jgi:hypothetical protein